MYSNLIETQERFVSCVHKTALQVSSVVKCGLSVSVFLSLWPPRYGSPETQVGNNDSGDPSSKSDLVFVFFLYLHDPRGKTMPLTFL